MNFIACDRCHAEGGKLVGGVQVLLSLNDERGKLDLCPKHRADLLEALEEFMDISRIATREFVCTECGADLASQGSLRKHRRRHELARQRRVLAATG